MWLGAASRNARSIQSKALRPSLPSSFPVRAFSTHDASATKEEDDGTGHKHQQPFVTTQIEPGEWDREKKDPLHKPKYRSRARILSKHDFARRNQVTFEEKYATFSENMITLSWMDHKTQRRIYENYLNWMVNAQEKFGRTSHEYVCRLLAQKFHITPFRAAAIVQLQHSEEQIKIQHPEVELLHEEGETMDEYMKHTISEAYRSTGEIPPESFVEPASQAGGMGSPFAMPVEDLMDFDQLTRDANVREQERARMMINDHIYIEDVDDATVAIDMSKDAMGLIKQKNKLKEHAQPDPPPSPTAAAAGRRPSRWKFVAQAIDTRELNPKNKISHYTREGKVLRGKKHRNRFQQDHVANTLIEEDGELRPANLAEVRKTSWKPVRHLQEFTYAGAKQGWLDRTIRGNNSAWGKKAILPGTTEAESSSKEESSSKDEVSTAPGDDDDESDGDEIVEEDADGDETVEEDSSGSDSSSSDEGGNASSSDEEE